MESTTQATNSGSLWDLLCCCFSQQSRVVADQRVGEAARLLREESVQKYYETMGAVSHLVHSQPREISPKSESGKREEAALRPLSVSISPSRVVPVGSATGAINGRRKQEFLGVSA